MDNASFLENLRRFKSDVLTSVVGVIVFPLQCNSAKKTTVCMTCYSLMQANPYQFQVVGKSVQIQITQGSRWG